MCIFELDNICRQKSAIHGMSMSDAHKLDIKIWVFQWPNILSKEMQTEKALNIKVRRILPIAGQFIY